MLFVFHQSKTECGSRWTHQRPLGELQLLLTGSEQKWINRTRQNIPEILRHTSVWFIDLKTHDTCFFKSFLLFLKLFLEWRGKIKACRASIFITFIIFIIIVHSLCLRFPLDLVWCSGVLNASSNFNNHQLPTRPRLYFSLFLLHSY